MNDTDFDLLCEGASPGEAKRIRKLLAEWCKGDENSFPVQMALLTRAQWRAASLVPQLMSECHADFERQLGELFGKFMQLVGNYEQSGQTKVKEMDRLLTFHGENVGRSIEQARSQLAAADKVSERIRGDLKQSAGCWKEAQEAFEEGAAEPCSDHSRVEEAARSTGMDGHHLAAYSGFGDWHGCRGASTAMVICGLAFVGF